MPRSRGLRQSRARLLAEMAYLETVIDQTKADLVGAEPLGLRLKLRSTYTRLLGMLLRVKIAVDGTKRTYP